MSWAVRHRVRPRVNIFPFCHNAVPKSASAGRKNERGLTAPTAHLKDLPDPRHGSKQQKYQTSDCFYFEGGKKGEGRRGGVVDE